MSGFDEIAVKEYGASFLFNHLSSNIMDGMGRDFPEWKEAFVFSCMRIQHNVTLKKVEFLYRTSFLPESIKDDRYLAIELTHVLSISEGIISALIGHISMDTG